MVLHVPEQGFHPRKNRRGPRPCGGSAKQAKGSIKDTVGGVIGDTKLQAEGKLDKVEGKAQNTFGGAKDSLRGDDKKWP
jgi:uncharacterized protein YjbJ (UPF0337 family)